MIAFIHSLTGTKFYVAEDRKAEYIAAGHTPAANTISAKNEFMNPPIEAEEPAEVAGSEKKKAGRPPKKK